MTGALKNRWQIAWIVLLLTVAARPGWCQQELMRRLPPLGATAADSAPTGDENTFFQVSTPINPALAATGWQPSSPGQTSPPTAPYSATPINPSYAPANQSIPYYNGSQFSPYAQGAQSFTDPGQHAGISSWSMPTATYGGPTAFPEGAGCAVGEQCCETPAWIKPCVEFYIGFIFLDQSAATSPIPLVIECDCVDGIFRPNTVDYDWREGIRASIFFRRPATSCCYPCPCDFEITYFGVSESWDQSGYGGDMLVLNQNVWAGTACVNYTSRLNSLELNCRHCAGPWKEWIFGVRWIELVERAGVTGIDWSGAVIVNEARDVYNGLIGLQAGVDRCLWDRGGLFTANAYAKGGLYNNHLSMQSVGSRPYGASTDALAFVGDVQVIGKYQLTHCLSLSAGYQFLWLCGVGMALDQFHNTPPNINDHDNVFFHGLNLGAEFRW